LALRLHLLICRNCRRFRAQLRFLETALHRLRDGFTVSELLEGRALSPQARQRIRQALGRSGLP
jgi:hypothetical protein